MPHPTPVVDEVEFPETFESLWDAIPVDPAPVTTPPPSHPTRKPIAEAGRAVSLILERGDI